MSYSLESTATLNQSSGSFQNDGYLIEQLIGQVQEGHESAACQLREFLASGVRWYLNRNARETSIEAGTRRVLDSVINAIRDRQITDMAGLTSLTRRLVRGLAVKPEARRRNTSPVDRQQVEHMKQALYELSPRERDALVKCFEGQQPARVCADLGISEAGLEALRFRVRTRCAELRTGSVKVDSASAGF